MLQIRDECYAVYNSAGSTEGQAVKFWNMIDISEDEGEITLYGDVMNRRPVDWWTGEPEPGLYITPEGFAEDLSLVKDKKKITVKLNSCGGDLYTGIAIHNALKQLSGSVKMVIDGIAASAASVIACAGDEVVVYPGSTIMIHQAATFMYGGINITDIKKTMKQLDAAERAIAAIYSAKTGIAIETLRSMITNETWMTGEEAVENGFADTLLTDGLEIEMQMMGDVLIVNGINHNIQGVNIPDRFRTRIAAVTPLINKKTSGKTEKEEIMTTEELRNKYPDLIAQIENAARSEGVRSGTEQEKERIKGIESIEASIGDRDLIRNAKYGEKPLDAAALALQAMQKQVQLGADFLNGMKKDTDSSGANGVPAAPNNGAGEPTQDEEITAVVNVYKKMREGGAK